MEDTKMGVYEASESIKVKKELKAWERRTTKSKNLRNFRDNQRSLQKMKQRDTLKRAAMPRTKDSRKKKKKNGLLGRAQTSLKPVNETHREMILKYEKDPKSLAVYEGNYSLWEMQMISKVAEAVEIDKKREEKYRRDQELKKNTENFQAHRKNFALTLKRIGRVEGHGLQTREWGENKFQEKKKATMLDYFSLSSNSTCDFTTRYYHQLYYREIKDSTKNIEKLPEFDPVTRKEIQRKIRKKSPGQEGKCFVCRVNMFADMKSGCMVCPQCGLVSNGGEGVSLKPSFAHMQSTVRPPAPYERIAHCKYSFYLFVFI